MKNMFRMAMLAVVLSAGSLTARAGVTFDPNPFDGIGPINLEQLDWAAGNALAVGSQPLATGRDFQLLSHARLNGFNNGLVTYAGLNAGFELTYVVSFPETTSLLVDAPPAGPSTGDTAILGFDSTPPSGAPNFFEIWYSADDSSDLSGTGFNNGILVLSGTVASSFGTYTQSTGGIVALDGFGADNYPGQLSISGGGFTDLFVGVTPLTVNPLFFPGLLTLDGLDFTTQVRTNFNTVDPSNNFVTAAGGAAPVNIGAGPAPGVAGNTIGSVNGFPAGGAVAGTDFQLQVDATSVIRGTSQGVPEPSSLVAFAGMLAVGALIARRRK